jgi:hypothetical protein
MLGAERFLQGCQRALLEWPCLRKVALVPEQGSEVVEARPCVAMLGAERLFVYRQRTLQEPRAPA